MLCFLSILLGVMRYLTLKYDKKMLRHREMLKKGEVPNIFKVIDQDPEA